MGHLEPAIKVHRPENTFREAGMDRPIRSERNREMLSIDGSGLHTWPEQWFFWGPQSRLLKPVGQGQGAGLRQ